MRCGIKCLQHLQQDHLATGQRQLSPISFNTSWLATSPIYVNSCFEQLQPWERWDCLCYYDFKITLNQSRILFTFAQSRWQTCIFFFGGNLWEIQRISTWNFKPFRNWAADHCSSSNCLGQSQSWASWTTSLTHNCSKDKIASGREEKGPNGKMKFKVQDKISSQFWTLSYYFTILQ